jgi:putative ATP-dependent endonuclease of OLD family
VSRKAEIKSDKETGHPKETRASTGKPKKSGIRVVEVRVRNFRSLKTVDVPLDHLTVLIGANNSGKTSFLEALSASLGGRKGVLTEDDIFLSPLEKSRPRDRSIIIDVMIRPIDDEGEIISSFPSGSYWTALWGSGISQDEKDNDFMAYRTEMKWSAQKAEYTVDRRFLKEWVPDPSKVETAKIKDSSGHVTAAMMEPIALHLIDAKRDIEDDLRQPGSFWRKLTGDLGLSDEDIKKFESILDGLNESMVEKSVVLKHVQSHLGELNSLISSEKEGVEIATVARRLRDLVKGINLNFTTKGSQTFPLAKHGMGTRSLASILVFRAFMSWRSDQSSGDAIHPMLALEEPEAHLHPQAQRALFHQISAIPGQIIISTHSPYVAGQVMVKRLRQFHKEGPETFVANMDTTNLSQEDLFKIDRKVMHTRGDMLFAKALVFFEGETEEFAFPVFAETYWERNIHLLGVNFVSVGGDGGYLPFIRMANSFKIPWYIFSDGEANAISKLKNACTQIGISNPETHPNITILPDGQNWEKYLISQGYEDAISSMLDSVEGESGYLDKWLKNMHGKSGHKGIQRDYESAGGRARGMFDKLGQNKLGYAKPLANHIVKLAAKERRIPAKLASLFKVMKESSGIS